MPIKRVPIKKSGIVLRAMFGFILGALGLSGLNGLQPLHAAAPITVVDDFARRVTLDAPAERIISLSPHNTENLFAAGAGDKIVGVGEYSDYPPAALAIPSVGSHAQVNLEAVIALAPDLIVAWQTGGNREALKKIEQLNYPVYYSEPRSFEDIIENIEELALLAGSTSRIHPPAADLRQELAAVGTRFGTKSIQRVFYQVWSDPLITLNGEHFISRVLELCGAENAFADLAIIAPRISIESVIHANPDIIITGRVGDLPPDLTMWKKWQSITAVKRGNFIAVDSGVMHRHTARMIMGIRTLCEEIDRVRQRR